MNSVMFILNPTQWAQLLILLLIIFHSQIASLTHLLQIRKLLVGLAHISNMTTLKNKSIQFSVSSNIPSLITFLFNLNGIIAGVFLFKKFTTNEDLEDYVTDKYYQNDAGEDLETDKFQPQLCCAIDIEESANSEYRIKLRYSVSEDAEQVPSTNYEIIDTFEK